MSNITLSTSQARKISQLLSSLNEEITKALGAGTSAPAPAKGRPASAKPAKAAGKGSSRAPRGSVKDAVITQLKAAGKEGVSVVDLANTIGTKTQNLYTWFNQTGKKIPQIKKVGRGSYRYVGR
jgi:hypothetical protein